MRSLQQDVCSEIGHRTPDMGSENSDNGSQTSTPKKRSSTFMLNADRSDNKRQNNGEPVMPAFDFGEAVGLELQTAIVALEGIALYPEYGAMCLTPTFKECNGVCRVVCFLRSDQGRFVVSIPSVKLSDVAVVKFCSSLEGPINRNQYSFRHETAHFTEASSSNYLVVNQIVDGISTKQHLFQCQHLSFSKPLRWPQITIPSATEIHEKEKCTQLLSCSCHYRDLLGFLNDCLTVATRQPGGNYKLPDQIFWSIHLNKIQMAGDNLLRKVEQAAIPELLFKENTQLKTSHQGQESCVHPYETDASNWDKIADNPKKPVCDITLTHSDIAALQTTMSLGPMGNDFYPSEKDSKLVLEPVPDMKVRILFCKVHKTCSIFMDNDVPKAILSARFPISFQGNPL